MGESAFSFSLKVFLSNYFHMYPSFLLLIIWYDRSTLSKDYAVNFPCYSTFLQVDELQNTIEEEQKSLVEEMRLATEEQKNGIEDASGGSDAMAVD